MKFPNLRIITVALAALALMAMAPLASATATGSLVIGSGCATVTVTATTIDWGSCAQGSTNNTGVTPPTDPAANFVTSAGTTLTFGSGTGVAVNDAGHLLNLTAGSLPVAGFMTIDAVPLTFDLNAIGPGPANTNCAALALFQTCAAAAGSPFSLELIPNNETNVGLAVAGKVTDSTDGHVSDWTGQFSTTLSAPLPNGAAPTPANVQSWILGGGSITSSHSGTFFVTFTSVPEPTTAFLGLSGLLMAAGLYRRRRRT